MQWHDLQLDVDKPIWRIPEVKGGGEGLAFISTDCATLLRARKTKALGSEYVFPKASDPTAPIPVPVKAWKRIMKVAGLSNVRPHDLRRTLATRQLNLGTALPLVGMSLNHDSLDATKIYARPMQDSVWESVNAANKQILKLANDRRDKASASVQDSCESKGAT